MKNKRGWIEILEAFFAIMLIAAALLILLNISNTEDEDFSYEVYQIELSILREIQINDSLRSAIASAPEPLPIPWEDEDFPLILKNKITERTPSYLNCVGKICNLTELCMIEPIESRDVYSNSVTITSTLTEGEVYRKLNLFCWTK
jgi:hypothetical protein